MQKTSHKPLPKQPAAQPTLDEILSELHLRVGGIPTGNPAPSTTDDYDPPDANTLPALTALIASTDRLLQELPEHTPHHRPRTSPAPCRSALSPSEKAGDPETLLQDQRRTLLHRAGDLPESRRRAVQKTVDMLFDVQQARLRWLDRLQTMVSGDSSEARELLINQLAAAGFTDAATLLDRFARLEHLKITGLVQALYPPETETRHPVSPPAGHPEPPV